MKRLATGAALGLAIVAILVLVYLWVDSPAEPYQVSMLRSVRLNESASVPVERRGFEEQLVELSTGQLAAAYLGVDPGSRTSRIFFRREEEGGWASSMPVSVSGTLSWPILSQGGENLYLSWLVIDLDRGKDHIKISRSTTGGLSWEPCASLPATAPRRPYRMTTFEEEMGLVVATKGPLEASLREEVRVYLSSDECASWREVDIGTAGVGNRVYDLVASGGEQGLLAWIRQADEGRELQPGRISSVGWEPDDRVFLEGHAHVKNLRYLSIEGWQYLFWQEAVGNSDRVKFSARPVGEAWGAVKAIVQQDRRDLSYTVSRCGEDVCVVWREHEGPRHRSRDRVIARRVTEGDPAKTWVIFEERELDELALTAEGLAAGSLNGELLVFAMEDAGIRGKGPILFGRKPDSSYGVLWRNSIERPTDKSSLALVEFRDRWCVLFREAPMGLSPAMTALQGNLMLLEFGALAEN